MKTETLGAGFNFHEVCNNYGLVPEKTSLHQAECLSRGLDPESTSSWDLELARRGMTQADITKYSVVQLTDMGLIHRRR